ncbi:DUF6233 domain-containing protein [Streptomyces sp. NPDC056061]|uniref:DUF6233 domain-containing protein n=1 Tax=Streptomyces sp. NPDC056061 TaxID=3345700 RepID=UPI0035E2639D
MSRLSAASPVAVPCSSQRKGTTRSPSKAIGKRHLPISREQALAALAEGIRACAHCRPDTELGVL